MASKVFISHSAKSDDHIALRDKLVSELKAVGIDAWVDGPQIKAGDEWLKRITEGLGECYAGIILFSADAVKSDFVKYEVSCLAQRKRLHSGFGLFALNLGDVGINEIKAGFFGSIRFADFQIKNFDTERGEVVETLTQLPRPTLTPTRKMEGDLLKYFRGVALETLQDIAAQNDWGKWDHLGHDAERLHFVRMLVSQPLTIQIKALTGVMEGLDVGYDVRGVFDKLAPSWVDEKAALELHAVRYRDEGKRGALINGKELQFTCDAFLRRADPARGRGLRFHASIPKGRQPGLRLAAQVRESLREQVKIPSGAKPESEEASINEKLDALEQADVRLTHALLLDKGNLAIAGPLSIVKGLQQRFPKVTFIALIGEGDFPEFAPPLEDNVTLVTPALTSDANATRHNEAYAKTWYDTGCVAFEALKPADDAGG